MHSASPKQASTTFVGRHCKLINDGGTNGVEFRANAGLRTLERPEPKTMRSIFRLKAYRFKTEGVRFKDPKSHELPPIS